MTYALSKSPFQTLMSTSLLVETTFTLSCCQSHHSFTQLHCPDSWASHFLVCALPPLGLSIQQLSLLSPMWIYPLLRSHRTIQITTLAYTHARLQNKLHTESRWSRINVYIFVRTIKKKWSHPYHNRLHVSLIQLYRQPQSYKFGKVRKLEIFVKWFSSI